jgi:L-asparagine oxygenase
MLKNVADIVKVQGFALIQSHFPEEPSLIAMSRFGDLLKIQDLAEVQELRPRLETEASPNIYSGNYGYGRFPLHTDLAHWCIPPHYLALRCITGTADVATHLLDGNEVIAAIGETQLRRTLVQPRRPLAYSRPLLRLYDQRDQDSSFLRWDNLFISPATAKSAITCAEMTSYLNLAKPVEIVLQHPGDTLVIDNWRILHGRSSVSSSSGNRQIDRAYIRNLQ